MSDPGGPATTTTAGSTGSTTTPSTSTTSSTSVSTGATTTSTSSSSNNNNSSTSSSTATTANTSITTAATTATTTAATSSGSSSSTSSSSSSSTATGRQAVPQISVYGGITDRQTVQVFQQALHRQPNTAAQYLQQMYAAQQQHLMLQTAALQQQHNLSTAQLQSLQASIAAGRQNSSQNGTSSQQTGSTQTTINLTTSPAAAQLISRAQSISSTPTSISQQAVLLGGPSSPTLTASQAQMYLRAQMAQQSNLVQVARSLGRAVPLSPQLIFTPTATVTAVQSENSSQNSSQNQVQNLAIRGQQGAASSSSQAQTLQALSLKQSPVAIQPASLKNPSQGSQASTGGRSGSTDASSEGGKKADMAPVTEVRAINMSRNVTAPPLIAPAYTQIQPQSLVQPHKQQQQQFVVHQSSQRTGQMLQMASIQPSQHPVPVLPKPANHSSSTPSQQATIFHSTISPHALHSSNNHAKAQPVQLTAINLQIQPTAPRLLHDNKDKPTSLVVRETCPPSKPQPKQPQQAPLQQQQAQQQPQPKPAPSPLPPTKPVEPPKVDPVAPAVQPQGVAATKRPPAATPPPVMTPGTESEAPTMTGCTPQNGENKPPQAIVKPQVLTHVIEGFVIQEGAEPFPVCVERLPVLIDSPRKLDHQLSSDPDKTPVSNAANSDSEPDELNPPEKEQEPKLTCEYCGWVDFAYTFKGSKRFCSVVCAKRYSLSCTKRLSIFRPDRSKPTKRWHRRGPGRPSLESKKQKLSPLPQTASGSVSSPHLSQPSQEESSPCSDMSSYEEPQSPASAASSGPQAPMPVQPQVHRQQSRTSDQEDRSVARDAPAVCQRLSGNDPTRWNVEQVYEFICSLPGCQEIADEFRSQEIDGQALLLLKEDHLMSTMNIKLGPALKIFARINMLKDS